MITETSLANNLANLLRLSETNKNGNRQPDNGHSLPLSNIPKSDTVSISGDARILQQISALEKQLDEIFGLPKQLSPTEQQQHDSIVNQIDKVFESYESPEISLADERKINKLTDKIDAIFADDVVTADEEKQLLSLEARLDKIFEPYEPQLSQADEEKVEALFKQLDQLEGLKPVDKEQLLRAENLLVKLDSLFDQLDSNQASS